MPSEQTTWFDGLRESGKLQVDVSLGGPTGEPTGRRLGRYPITRELGAGGMADVLRGRDPELGRELAVKVARDPSNPVLLNKFVMEA